jgi:hypothetical protein
MHSIPPSPSFLRLFGAPTIQDIQSGGYVFALCSGFPDPRGRLLCQPLSNESSRLIQVVSFPTKSLLGDRNGLFLSTSV